MKWSRIVALLPALVIIIMVLISVPPSHAQEGGRGKGEPVAGNRLFRDDFATFVNRWEINETDTYTIDYIEQALHFDLQDEVNLLSRPTTPLSVDRYILNFTMTFLANSDADSFAGLVFNYRNDNNYYLFGIRPTGHYEIRIRQNGKWRDQPLVKGYYPDLAEEDEPVYTLKLLYDQGYAEININDDYLVPFFDDRIKIGEFGLFAESNGMTYVIFDDFEVFDLRYE